MFMIIRKKYLERIIPFINKPLIKAIIGVRRSGKTVLMMQLKDYLISSGIDAEHVLYINFESMAFSNLLDSNKLYSYVLEVSKKIQGKRLYLFFDEIQVISYWETLLASFLVDIDCDIYISGSNSKLLSSELATHIAGRYIHIDIYPFNFLEYKDYSKDLEISLSDEELFNEYLEFGGLPQSISLPNSFSKKTYLRDVYNTIVVNDIAERNKISDLDLLKRLIVFLLDNIGNTFSANSIAKSLSSLGIKTSVPTILTYISYILKSLIIYPVRRYDIKGKQLLSTSEKYFCIDLGLRNCIKSSERSDYSKLFENIIFLEMLGRGYEVAVGKVGDYEIDFVCYNHNKERLYIQVAYMLSDQATIDREFRPLYLISDNYPKIVISADKFDFSRDGIKHYNIIDFLKNTDFQNY